MNNSDIKKKLKTLQKESEDKKHERKILATDYEKQTEIVKKSGIVAAVSFLFHYVVLVSMMHNTKHVTLAGLGRFLSPFVMIIFIGSFVVFLIKGFDLFVNSDTKYSKPLAEKLKIVNPVAAELRRMNDTITMLDVEIDKLENELYESGESFEIDDEKITDIKMQPGVKEKKRVVKKIVLDKPEAELPKVKDVNGSDKDEAKVKKNDIDDLFSGLDELVLDDDEDDFESSSEMWEKDAMRRFSRY